MRRAGGGRKKEGGEGGEVSPTPFPDYEVRNDGALSAIKITEFGFPLGRPALGRLPGTFVSIRCKLTVALPSCGMGTVVR